MVCSHLEASDLQVVLKVNAYLDLTSVPENFRFQITSRRGSSLLDDRKFIGRLWIPGSSEMLHTHKAVFLFKTVCCCCDCCHEL